MINYFRDITGTEIYVPWARLEKAGITRKTPVTVRVRNLSFGASLSAVQLF